MRSRLAALLAPMTGRVRARTVRARRPVPRLMVSLMLALALADCGGGSHKPQAQGPAPVPFFGAVVSPEPLAGEVARNILAEGGTAADAAVALGFSLAVTLPSRAGLGGGGACLAYMPAKRGPGGGAPEAILFLPGQPAGELAGDRPAAVPMLARGLFLLHARYGRVPIEQLIGDAQAMARLGVVVSPALADDIAAVVGPLLADPAARSVFATPAGMPLTTGQVIVQPDLANTLSLLRVSGVLGFYQGAFAERLSAAATQAGGGFSAADLARAIPTVTTPIFIDAGSNRVAFLPAPADGGLAAAAAFSDLWHNPQDLQAAAERALAVAALWRAGKGAPAALLAAKDLPATGLPPLPASTAFATLDAQGGAVACALTMNNLFGTGRIAPGTGILLAAAPSSGPLPLLAAAIAWNNNIHAFRAEVAGSGQIGAAMAVATGMVNTLTSKTPMPVPVPEPGRAQVIACSRHLPGNAGSCAAATDPRGKGFQFPGG